MNNIRSRRAWGVSLLAFALLSPYAWSEAGRGDPAERPNSSVSGDGHSPHAAHQVRELGIDAEIPEGSIYVVTSRWKNQRGKSVSLGELAGRPAFVSLFYSSCTVACPAIVENMRKIAKRATEVGPRDASFVLVSLDPARDTAERLADVAEERGLSGDAWQLLTGSDSDLRELVVLLGSKYRRLPDGEFQHSNVVAALDRDGRVVMRREGLRLDEGAITELVRSVSR